MVRPKIKTPCIGVCSTGIGDSVCRGCKRFSHEIIDWNGYTNLQKQAVTDRLEFLLVQVVDDKFSVLDETQLRGQLVAKQVRFNPAQNPLCWVFDLLKAGASQIDDFRLFGVGVKSRWREHSASDLRDLIDADYYALSCAHHQRYFLL
ncbi:conserved hypothetical protein [Teredinibacter turnerae T7901]|uniref:Fe-S protein n=1 Tax=Teredinibacter turnerae (strain ATCC 39867 / T7901) TaxID=377629 RepID=C5BI08_TERTT|nr:DUF1289 domain-containing protein [Teredinibacter turnerae]ACR13105.1 conserved hypothetical protein [Teredinibacter turnerae T7901]